MSVQVELFQALNEEILQLRERVAELESEQTMWRQSQHLLRESAEYYKRLLAEEQRTSEEKDKESMLWNAEEQSILLQHALDRLLFELKRRNTVEKDLMRRDAILQAIGFAAEELLRSNNLHQNIHSLLARLGQATTVSRVSIFENHTRADGTRMMCQRYRWVAPTISDEAFAQQEIPYVAAGYARWEEFLSNGKTIYGNIQTFPEIEQAMLHQQHVISIIIAPIFVGNQWWGYIRFDECLHEREWSLPEIEAIKVVENIIGSVINRHQIQCTLEKNESELRKLYRAIEQSPVAIVITDNTGAVEYVNPKFTQITGFSFWESFEQHSRVLTSQMISDEEHAQLWDVVASEKDWQGELQNVRKDGTIFWDKISISPILNAYGKITNFVAVKEDITEHKRMQERLRESQVLLQGILDHMPASVFIRDTKGNILLVNQHATSLIQCDGNDLIGKHMYELFPPDLSQIWQARDHMLAVQREPLMNEDVIDIHQTPHTFLTISFPLLNEQNNIYAIGSISTDITERKQAEKALQQSREQFRLIADFTFAWEYWVGPEGNYLYVSPSCERITGFHQNDFYTNPDLMNMIIHPDDHDRMLRHFEEELYTQEPLATAFRIVTKHGHTEWIGHVCQSVYSPDGEWLGRRASNREITSRKEMEEALKASEERFRLLAENAQDIIFRYRLSDKPGYEYISPSVTTILGYTPEEYYADPYFDLKILHPSSKPQFSSFTQSSTNLREPITLAVIHKEGRMVWIEQRHWLVYDSNGKAIAIEGIMLDITERKRIERELQNANEQLSIWISELEQRNREITLINALSETLQSCHGLEDAYHSIERFAINLFPDQPGVLYILDHKTQQCTSVAQWGQDVPCAMKFVKNSCHALQQKQKIFIMSPLEILCGHLEKETRANALFPYACIPLQAQGKTLGVLHIRKIPNTSNQQFAHWKHLTTMIAEHLALALANLHLREQLREQSIRDPLTNLFNRRYLDETLQREIHQAIRQKRTIGIIMLDIDNFKGFNDTYGHDAGDLLLRALGTFLQMNIRSEDIACRYGGEEFILILPEASLEDTRRRAENLRENVQHLQVYYEQQPLRTVTLSLGIACFPQHGTSVAEVTKKADQALYQAKRSGRNRVVLAEDETNCSE